LGERTIAGCGDYPQEPTDADANGRLAETSPVVDHRNVADAAEASVGEVGTGRVDAVVIDIEPPLTVLRTEPARFGTPVAVPVTDDRDVAGQDASRRREAVYAVGKIVGSGALPLPLESKLKTFPRIRPAFVPLIRSPVPWPPASGAQTGSERGWG
jgi:hypothetical protein